MDSRPVNQDSPYYRQGERVANDLLNHGEGSQANFWLDIANDAADRAHQAEDVPAYLAARGCSAVLADYLQEQSC